jgi:hypothetical protein
LFGVGGYDAQLQETFWLPCMLHPTCRHSTTVKAADYGLAAGQAVPRVRQERRISGWSQEEYFNKAEFW